MTDKYPGLPLEQRIGALRDGDVTHHGEPVGSMPLTVQPPRRPVMADDIIAQIEAELSLIEQHGTEVLNDLDHATLLVALRDEIVRLQAEVARLGSFLHPVGIQITTHGTIPTIRETQMQKLRKEPS